MIEPKAAQTTLDNLDKNPGKAQKEVAVQNQTIEQVPLTSIDPFPDHPYQVRDDEEMLQLANSISEQGVVSPAIVRKKEDGRYGLISGHRRKRACELASIEAIPVVVVDLTDEQASVLMVESNYQREKVLPSEKAYAYKIRMDALRKQGKRTDLTSRPVVGKSDSAELVGASNGESGRQVQRYIRLTELIPHFLKMVDEEELPFRIAVEISYLLKKEQQYLKTAMEREVCTPSLSQVQKFKMFSKEGTLTPQIIASTMQERKPNQVEKIHIPKESISRFFKKDDTPSAIAETIVKALEMYRKKDRSREMER